MYIVELAQGWEYAMRFVFASIWIALLTLWFPFAARAENRVALVIGNSAYRNAPALLNPRNDAEAVGRSLKELGFATIVATDLDHSGMNDALDRFSRTVTGAEIAIIYYAGHGMQFAGKNYLLPIDARLASVDDVNKFRLTPLDDFFETVKAAQRAVVVLDACRNNPLEEELKHRLASLPGVNRDAYLSRGLGRVPTTNGLIVAYSTQANDVAADGTGSNSPFTSAFLHNVGVPDLDLTQMLIRVQNEVSRVSGGRQRPELSLSPVDEFKLKVAVGSPKPEDSRPNQGASNQAPVFDPRAMELSFWESVRNSTTITMVETYLDRYPGGTFAALAKARIQELQRQQQPLHPQLQQQPQLQQNQANLTPPPPSQNSLVPRTYQQPSRGVDCARPNEPTEVLICADAELAEADGQMGSAYASKLQSAGNTLRQQQRDWITRRGAQCQVPKTGNWSVAELAPLKACILRMTRQRLYELSSR
jgi:uncharacterized caspase-like protein/uncharacterized protein YecT (DUF1311 family)